MSNKSENKDKKSKNSKGKVHKLGLGLSKEGLEDVLPFLHARPGTRATMDQLA